ncbi:MAG: hypothetical protein HY619_04110 [Thaumarchaeota archaeon]|nr:hypothetical protein [Nitrososphaerota archaeon]
MQVISRNLRSWFIDEPELLFGDGQRSVDPRTGVLQYGPYYPHEIGRPTPSEILVGLVGDGETIGLLKNWLSRLETTIQGKLPSSPIQRRGPYAKSRPNPHLFPGFLGFLENKTFRCKILTYQGLEQPIDPDEVKLISNEPDPNRRIALASDLFSSKVERLKDVHPPPMVILCGLPEIVDEYAGSSEKTKGSSRPRITRAEQDVMELMEQGQKFLSDFDIGEPPIRQTSYSYDLRRAMKWKCMKHGIPIQIMRYSTLLAKGELEDEATRAWNFSVALYYKADGYPWRLADFDPNTCYVGISFYKEKLSTKEYLRTSFAQVFTSYGDGLVLRGEEAHIDEKLDRQPHLSESSAFSLLEDCLTNYVCAAKHTPTRIVVHKSSRFNNDEKRGFERAAERFGRITMVAFGNRGIRVLREGKYPPLRGTLIELPDKSYLLYTSGYSPFLSTYPGHRIPEPLEILEIYPLDDPTLIAKEILSLSKLNFNSARFSSKKPITLGFADEVKKILSEMPPDAPMQNRYKFYM